MEGPEAVLRQDLSRYKDQIQDPNLNCNKEMLEDAVFRTVQTLNSLSGLALGETNVWLQVPWSLLPGNLTRTFPSFAWLVLGAAMGFLEPHEYRHVLPKVMRFANHMFRWESQKFREALPDHTVGLTEHTVGMLVQFCRYLRFSARVSGHHHAKALKRGLKYYQDYFGSGRYYEYFGRLHAIRVCGHIALQFRATGDFDKAAETSREMLKLAAEHQIQSKQLLIEATEHLPAETSREMLKLAAEHQIQSKQLLIEATWHLPPQEVVDALERATEWKSWRGIRGEGESYKGSLTAMILMLTAYCHLRRFKEAAQLVQLIDQKPKDIDPKVWMRWLIQKRMFYEYTGNILKGNDVCLDIAELSESSKDPATCLAEAELCASQGEFEDGIVALNKCAIFDTPELDCKAVFQCCSDPQILVDHMSRPTLLTNRGMFHLALEQFDEALADIEEGMRIAKKYFGSDLAATHPYKLTFPFNYWCQAQCLFQMGRFEEAQSRLEDARSSAPEDSYIQHEIGCMEVLLLTAAKKPEEAAAKVRENFLKFIALQSSLGRGRRPEWESLHNTNLGASAQNMECTPAGACERLVWTERKHMRLFMFETTEKRNTDLEDFNRFDMDDEYARSVIAEAAERCVDSSTAIIVYSLCLDQSHVPTFLVTRVAKDGNLAPTLNCSHCRMGLQKNQVEDSENWRSVGMDMIVNKISDALNDITLKSDSKLHLGILYEFFMQSLEPYLELPDGIETLLISAHGEFSRIPFAALYDHRDKKFLIQKKCLGIIPGFRALHYCFKNQDLFDQNYSTAKLCPPFVAGNPSPMGRQKKNLPRAEEEAEEVARLFGAPPCVGSNMTKRDVKAGLENSSLVHVATHGIMGEDDPSQGFLVMQANQLSCEEALTGSEMSELKVRAGLVVLSACRSGDGIVTREGLLGLGRAVLLAGASTVIVTLWKVDDNATKELMIELMKEFCKGEKTVNQCLQLAMLQMIERGKEIYEWAPFVVLGSPTMRWPRQELASELTSLSIN